MRKISILPIQISMMRTCNAADFTTILLQFRIPPNLLIVGLRSCASLCIYVGCSLGFQSLFFVCARSSAILQIEHTTSHREIDNSCSLRIARTVSARVDRSLLLVSIYRQLYFFLAHNTCEHNLLFMTVQHQFYLNQLHDISSNLCYFLIANFFYFKTICCDRFTTYVRVCLIVCVYTVLLRRKNHIYLDGCFKAYLSFIYIINALRLLTGRQILRKAVHTQYTPSFIHQER